MNPAAQRHRTLAAGGDAIAALHHHDIPTGIEAFDRRHVREIDDMRAVNPDESSRVELRFEIRESVRRQQTAPPRNDGNMVIAALKSFDG